MKTPEEIVSEIPKMSQRTSLITVITTVQNEAYNQAIDDVTNSMFNGFNVFNDTSYIISKDQFLKLKK